MAIVTIGILGHVDAGKTSHTERILSNNGAFKSVGSVDLGVATRRLARPVRSAHPPMLIVVNKIDRLGARAEPRSFPCTHFGH